MDSARNEEWFGSEYSFFSHKDCEYFPCHKGIDAENFNCLFCYCPLYALGDKCGGTFSFTERGYKNCMNCIRPHKRENYGEIIGRYPEIAEMIKKNRADMG
ncbi:MAG: cysteine-rich small domain-containing protein [Oscillospiraceae bacterium]|jgi:Zn-finger protein|nr:cysteine-rich small domain-containing protein [Oscillospiraceae bacterium]